MAWLPDAFEWVNVDRGDLIVTCFGALVGAIALIVSRRTARATERNASASWEQTRIAAESAENQARIAKESAQHAQESAELAKRQLEQDVELFHLKYAPYIYADIRGDEARDGLLILLIENIGSSVATDVVVKFDPPLDPVDMKALQGFSTIRISALAPGRQVRYTFDVGHVYLSSGKPLIYNIHITAQSRIGEIVNDYTINLEDLRNMLAIGQGNLKNVADAIKNTNKMLAKIVERLPKSQ